MNVDKFKVAHATINASLHNIRQMCQRGIREESGAIADEIVRMSSTIKLHLAAEDLHLYPVLLSSRHANVAYTARMFKDEMGGLAEAYTSFAKKMDHETGDRIRAGRFSCGSELGLSRLVRTHPERKRASLSAGREYVIARLPGRCVRRRQSPLPAFGRGDLFLGWWNVRYSAAATVSFRPSAGRRNAAAMPRSESPASAAKR